MWRGGGGMMGTHMGMLTVDIKDSLVEELLGEERKGGQEREKCKLFTLCLEIER